MIKAAADNVKIKCGVASIECTLEVTASMGYKFALVTSFVISACAGWISGAPVKVVGRTIMVSKTG